MNKQEWHDYVDTKMTGKIGDKIDEQAKKHTNLWPFCYVGACIIDTSDEYSFEKILAARDRKEQRLMMDKMEDFCTPDKRSPLTYWGNEFSYTITENNKKEALYVMGKIDEIISRVG